MCIFYLRIMEDGYATRIDFVALCGDTTGYSGKEMPLAGKMLPDFPGAVPDVVYIHPKIYNNVKDALHLIEYRLFEEYGKSIFSSPCCL